MFPRPASLPVCPPQLVLARAKIKNQELHPGLLLGVAETQILELFTAASPGACEQEDGVKTAAQQCPCGRQVS